MDEIQHFKDHHPDAHVAGLLPGSMLIEMQSAADQPQGDLDGYRVTRSNGTLIGYKESGVHWRVFTNQQQFDRHVNGLPSSGFPTEFALLVFAFIDHLIRLRKAMAAGKHVDVPGFHVVKTLSGSELGALGAKSTKDFTSESPLLFLALCCGDESAGALEGVRQSVLDEIVKGAEDAGSAAVILAMLGGATFAVRPPDAPRALWTDQSASLHGAAATVDLAELLTAFDITVLLNKKRDEMLRLAKVDLRKNAAVIQQRLDELKAIEANLGSDPVYAALRAKLATVMSNAQAFVDSANAQAQRLETSGRWAFEPGERL
jgi:hypothetical protein